MPFLCSALLICSVALIGVWWPSASAAAYLCTSETVTACLAAFTYNNIDVFHLDDDVPTWNDSTSRLNDRCQAYTTFSSCMQTVTPACNDSLRLALHGLDNAYQYLCTKYGMADFSSNQSCYIQPEVRSFTTGCNYTYFSKLSSISYNDNAVSLYCKYVDDYIDCLTQGITSLCGVGAAKWESDWIRNLRRPEMQISKCPGWVTNDETNSVWATALLVALALTTALMIVGIITLIVFIVRKRMFRERLRRALNGGEGVDGDLTPLPPPYSIVVETPGPDGELQPHLVDSLSSASSEAPLPNRNSQAGSSVPFKVPILPPPYLERPEESAPPYFEHPKEDAPPNYDSHAGVSGRTNEGFHENEACKKLEGIPEVGFTRGMFSKPDSEA